MGITSWLLLYRTYLSLSVPSLLCTHTYTHTLSLSPQITHYVHVLRGEGEGEREGEGKKKGRESKRGRERVHMYINTVQLNFNFKKRIMCCWHVLNDTVTESNHSTHTTQ